MTRRLLAAMLVVAAVATASEAKADSLTEPAAIAHDIALVTSAVRSCDTFSARPDMISVWFAGRDDDRSDYTNGRFIDLVVASSLLIDRAVRNDPFEQARLCAIAWGRHGPSGTRATKWLERRHAAPLKKPIDPALDLWLAYAAADCSTMQRNWGAVERGLARDGLTRAGFRSGDQRKWYETTSRKAKAPLPWGQVDLCAWAWGQIGPDGLVRRQWLRKQGRPSRKVESDLASKLAVTLAIVSVCPSIILDTRRVARSFAGQGADFDNLMNDSLFVGAVAHQRRSFEAQMRAEIKVRSTRSPCREVRRETTDVIAGWLMGLRD